MRIGLLRYKALNIVMLLRPQFLVASAIMFLLGFMAVGGPDDILEAPYLAALASAVLVQLSAGLVNEYTDWKGDRFARKSLFAGGSGEIATGRVTPSAALSLAIVSVAIAIALGIYVDAELEGRELFLPLLIASAVLAWCFSVRPIRLVNTAFGELLEIALLVWILPMMAMYLVTGAWTDDVLPYQFVLTMFGLASIIGVEFPDKQADIRSMKRNLTYRFGVERMAEVQCVLLFVGYASTVAFVLSGYMGWVNVLVFATLLYGWTSIVIMKAPKHYDYEWARSSTTMMTSIFVVSMALALIDVVI
ncbi:MAG: prenyltransferase [Euryarchaeota archaeon]|nr:prenyltransferase [Euryarchaeota archaeon]